MVRRAEPGARLGAAKHCGGGKALTGTGVLPQINEGEGMPASGMHEPPVQGAARELAASAIGDVPGAPSGGLLRAAGTSPLQWDCLHCAEGQHSKGAGRQGLLGPCLH